MQSSVRFSDKSNTMLNKDLLYLQSPPPEIKPRHDIAHHGPSVGDGLCLRAEQSQLKEERELSAFRHLSEAMR